jgi:hypothetical protein
MMISTAYELTWDGLDGIKPSNLTRNHQSIVTYLSSICNKNNILPQVPQRAVLAGSYFFKDHELSDISRLVEEHESTLLEAWHEYFDT